MDQSLMRRFLTITTLVVLMLLPGMARAEEGHSPAEVRVDEAASLFWSALADIGNVLVAMWDDNGPSLDPWGRPKPTSGPGGEGPLVGVLVDER